MGGTWPRGVLFRVGVDQQTSPPPNWMPTLLGVSKVRLKVPSLSPMKASWRQQKTRCGWVGFLLFDGNQKSGFNSPVEVDRGKGSWNLPLFTTGFYIYPKWIYPKWLALGFLNHQQYHPMESFQNLENVLMIFWRLRVEALLELFHVSETGLQGNSFPSRNHMFQESKQILASWESFQ